MICLSFLAFLKRNFDIKYYAMKKQILFGLVTLLLSYNSQAQTKKKMETKDKALKETIYQFKVKDIEGNQFDFSSLKGKKIMVVNTASKCGLTPQYKDLEVLYNKYKRSNFVIVGFPANNFGSQEPGTNEEIAAFCERNYGVSFLIMSKISVKGEDMHPLYEFLTEKAKNGFEDSQVEWNFQKYLINEKGELELVISPKVLPTDATIVNWIENKG